ncbi:MAG: hypothetical protein ABI321_02055 [Polyangia bacterium]
MQRRDPNTDIDLPTVVTMRSSLVVFIFVCVFVALTGCRDYAHFDRLPDAAADGSANVDAGPDPDGGFATDGGSTDAAMDAGVDPVCVPVFDLGPLDGPPVTIGGTSVSTEPDGGQAALAPQEVRLLQLDGPGAATDAVALIHDSAGNSNLLLRVPAILGPHPGGAQAFKIDQPGALFAAGTTKNGEAHVIVADVSGTMTEYRWTGTTFEVVGLPVQALPNNLALHAVAILQLNADHPQLVTVRVVSGDLAVPATVSVFEGTPASFLGMPTHYPLTPQHDALSLVASNDRSPSGHRSIVAFLPSIGSNGAQAIVLPGTSMGFGPGIILNPGSIMTAHTVAAGPIHLVADHELPMQDNIVFGTDDGVVIFTLYVDGTQDQPLFQTTKPVYALQVVDWNRDGAPDLFAFVRQSGQSSYAPTIFQNRGRVSSPDFTVVSAIASDEHVTTMVPDSLRSPAVPDCGAVAVFADLTNAKLAIFRP